MTGWIVRAVASQDLMNLPLYIAQTILIYTGPPIYAAAEYNILGHLMHYLPMHAPLNPSRVVWLFIYLGAAVEGLTGAGAGKLSKAQPGTPMYLSGGTLISVSLILQGVVECFFVSMVAHLHRQCIRTGTLAPNVRIVCIMLYGTSSLIFLRCIFRAVQTFTQYTGKCGTYYCGSVSNDEWYLYVFEAAPIVLYTLWMNIIHPGRFLPTEHKRYLDPDGKTERVGPGWIDKRSEWMTFIDLFDVAGGMKGRPESAQFWLRPGEWPACEDGFFALGTASNRKKRRVEGKESA